MQIGARLKKDDKKRYLDELLAIEEKAQPTEDEERRAADIWGCLANDHYARLRLDLNHIAHLQIVDIIQRDALGSYVPIDQIIQHYKGYKLDAMENGIRDAERALAWLQGVIDRERERRELEKTARFKVIAGGRRA